MSKSYFQSLGIQPWDSTHPIMDAHYFTLTILAQNDPNPNQSWIKIIEKLKTAELEIYEWRTMGTKLSHSKVLELKTIKSLKSKLGETCQFKKNQNNNSITLIRSTPKLNPDDIDRMRDNRNSVLIIHKAAEDSKSSILETLANYYSGVSAQSIKALLSSEPDAIIVSVFPNETHEVIQIIYSENKATKIQDMLSKIHINPISESFASQITKKSI